MESSRDIMPPDHASPTSAITGGDTPSRRGVAQMAKLDTTSDNLSLALEPIGEAESVASASGIYEVESTFADSVRQRRKWFAHDLIDFVFENRHVDLNHIILSELAAKDGPDSLFNALADVHARRQREEY